MIFWKQVRLLVLRSLKEERFLALLSIFGVALGIGLFVGVKSASDRSVSSFKQDLEGVGGYANYEVLDTAGVDFPEDVYPQVRQIEEDALPVLQTTSYIPAFRNSLRIEGIYTVKASAWLPPGLTQKLDIIDFYRTPNGVMLTADVVKRYSLKKGDTFSALVYDGRYDLKIVDILTSEALPPGTAVMDLGNYQDFFHKTGYLSRIDLKTDPKTAARVQEILQPSLAVERKQALIDNRLTVLKSFRYNLQFVSFIAILVGIFLLYNTVFISVVKRRTEIGILRALGMSRKTVVLLFIIQGLILGFCGSVAGIGLGQTAAYFSDLAVEKTISSMYRAITISDHLITKGDILLALVLGLLVSVLASAIPAYESSTIPPNESSKEGSFEGRYRGSLRIFFGGGLLLVSFGGLLAFADYRYSPFDFPFLSYGGILFVILGFSMVCPSYLQFVVRIVRGTSERFLGATGKIAVGDITGNTYRFSVALMSVAISSALIMALLTLIFSFRISLSDWIHKNIAADIYVKPASCTSNFCFFPLSTDLVKEIEAFPEVAGLDKFRTLSITFRGKKIVAGFGDRSVRRRFARRHEGAEGELSGREVGISTFLATRYGIRKGDTIEIQTPAGGEDFIVGDIFSSYSTTSGFVYIDRRFLKEFWGLDDATQLAVYVKRGVDLDRFIAKLRSLLLPRYSVDIMNNEELRRRVLGIFNRTFAITYAIELISIIVSLIGVVNTLLALVLERKREISIMRYLGAGWSQIRDTIVFSSGIVGISGTFLGAVLGGFMSVIFIKVVNKISFGWEIHFHLPVLYLSAVGVILILTTLAAGLIPAKVARKIDPKRFISFE